MPPALRRLLRLTLLLYPRGLRRSHGREMMEVFDFEWVHFADSRTKLLRVWLIDAARAIPLEHLRAWRRRLIGPEGPETMGGGWMGWIDAVVGDVKFGLRALAKRPGLAAVVAMTLGLGIGGNAALFSVLDRTLLRPFPFENGERMGYLLLENRERESIRTPNEWEFGPILAGTPQIEAVEFFRESGATERGDERSESINTLNVSRGLLDLLGLSSVHGRAFSEEDARADAAHVLMMHEASWRDRRGADPNVLGETVRLNDTIFTVIGVWPKRAHLRGRGYPDYVRVLTEGEELEPGRFTIPLVRLREGSTFAEASERAARAFSRLDGDRARQWEPVVSSPAILSGARIMWIAFAGVSLILLAALANVTNLLLSRTIQRTEELGVRLSLGASRGQIARLFLVENALFAGLGLGAALICGHWLLDVVPRIAPQGMIPAGSLDLDGDWLRYAFLLAVGCCLTVTLVPLLSVSAGGATDVAKGRAVVGGRRASRTGHGLVTAQIAITLVLLTGTGLILRSMSKMMHIDTGLDLDRVLVVSARLPSGSYPEEEDRRAFFERVEEETRAIPGVRGVSPSGNVPLGFALSSVPTLGGYPEMPVHEGEVATSEGVGPEYFEVMGIDLLAGRTFRRGDDDRNVVIVNDAFRRRSRRPVVGRELVYGSGDSSRSYEIVGVVDDVLGSGLVEERSDRVQVYHPRSGSARAFARFVLRTDADPTELIPAVGATLHALEPHAIVTFSAGLEYVRSSTSRHRFFVRLLGVFATLALLLATTGVYAVVSLAVNRRTREIGLRKALGAGIGRVSSEVVRAGMRPVLFGGLLGLAGAVITSRALRGFLYEIGPLDPLTFASALSVLAAVGVLACWLPARRAGSVDPMVALRAE